MVGPNYPSEHRLGKANAFNTKAPFLGLGLAKKYEEWDGFTIVGFSFLNGHVLLTL